MSWKLGGLGGSSPAASLAAASCPSNDLARTNRVFMAPSDFAAVAGRSGSRDALAVSISSAYVYVAAPHAAMPPGSLGFNAVQRRELRLALGDPVTVTALARPPPEAAAATFEVDLSSKRAAPVDVQADELMDECRKRLEGHVPSAGQTFVLDFYGTTLMLKAASVVTAKGSAECAVVTRATDFYFAKAPGTALALKGSESRPKEIFRADFNFEKMGIGGLDKEFSDIFRRAFASRVFPPSVVDKLGIQHVKGMLLYGPPGTGKTLIARQIGKMLNGKEPKVVNGPEILNKYVGQSEENVRNLFKDAEDDFAQHGDDSELHIVIFDEIDAICKQRGSTGNSTGVHDTVVNQLLSKIDGVNSLNNILVIGMTNRKDMIDDALLRPGRLEVHVEISLPDERGRQQILRIHTGKMRTNGMLADDVAVDEIAAGTKNFSGAEIEGLCKSAAAFALNRHVDYRDLQKKVDASGVRVTMDDFRKAMVEVQPAFGMGKDDFARCLLGGFLTHGPRMQQLVEAGKLFRDQVAESERSPLLSVLIEGPSGSGSTALAAYLAVDSGFPFVRIVSPESFVGYSEAAKCAALAKIFDDAHKSPLSVVVLDNVERLLEYTQIGPRFSNAVLQTLMILVKSVPPKGRRLLILATTSCVDVMRNLGFMSAFSATLSTPVLQREEIAAIVDGTAYSVNLNLQSDGGATAVHSSASPATRFRSSSDREFALSLLETEHVGVKKLLMILNMARAEAPDGSYVIEVDRLKAVLKDVL
jgi:vesicle-fusing ATPase